ncbi:hypothetical protein [Roseibium algae]|uniref:Uncharacterized protein n=1 Tax=Roseibium algae TaxID=3123038 RepID=A0ABU8TKZ7_9HYPH
MDDLHKRHMKRLQTNAVSDIAERLPQKTAEKKKREKLSDDVSALWNKRQKEARQKIAGQASDASPSKAESSQQPGVPLPDGWRDEHWKTLQSMAADFAGAQTTDKASSIAVLEAYEAALSVSN